MVNISDDIANRVPGIELIYADRKVVVGKIDSAVEYALTERYKQIEIGLQSVELSKLETIKYGRAAYRRLGKDPTRYRLSSEKLLRRIKKGERVPSINNVVDVMNWLSIELQAPIGVYDRNLIKGDVTLDFGRPGESYSCLAGYDLNLENIPLLRDDLGPFGSPTSDSIRTSITKETRHIFACIYKFDLNAATREYEQILVQFLNKL
ncbi:B3/B4 domain-containing protein [Fusibacter tunisiensis]|jgi:DNA/RNA-binding domain of Phe-tRNA-synthetase-like protein|uniref:DNA/RNA-binding domain of Phe-tRNA-synthetase-like protein n=1 Tax=Fusibacter tunisiensis TaxID=1008308 RepID=A0ABS2MS05_9FIRM|nr:phenylalanine--tRNA ligase beta subunit-related protein [Fusibacter tunisiensis]MBM7562082.1 DNA/RNA-binding domain of Phe-tRNA-synthetase-like protein [Fusibacter tunisiensis]